MYTRPIRRPSLEGIVVGLALCLTHRAGHAEVEYPGPNPGSAIARLASDQLVLSNRVVGVSWNLRAGVPQNATIADVQGGRTLLTTGAVFRVVLADGSFYSAGDFRSDRDPVLSAAEPASAASRWAERVPGYVAEIPMISADGRLRVRWRARLIDGANYVREELDLAPVADDLLLREVIRLDEPIRGATTAGTVDGSPVTAGNTFLGVEDPMAVNEATNERVVCRLPRPAPLRRDEHLEVSFVWGVAPPGQMRRAFLHYLERERAHPYRPYLHYNSWYDIAWRPFALNETNCLEAIRLFGERFIQRHAVVLDGLVFDDGWDDPRSLWGFHAGFPQGFAPLAALCRRYGTRLGVWLSPFGGYGEPRAQRLRFGSDQGYETNAAGFSLAGPNYYGAFKQACVRMIRDFGVNHFKFDGIATGMYARGGGDYVRDTEAMRRLMGELRREDSNLYINLTTGSWPSPFWLRYADSLWRQGDDMGHAGKGPTQQQWLTYRDQEVRRNIVGQGPLYPLNALMTQGVAYSREGMAGDATFNSAGFKDDVRAFFGSGTSLQELYVQPGRLSADDWQVLAEAAKWSRANADALVDTHWIGGDPARLEVYGYASWSRRLGIVMLRNPNDRPQPYDLDVGTAFELPAGAPTRFRLRSPWAEDAAKPALTASTGRAVGLDLEPFQVLVLEAHPVD